MLKKFLSLSIRAHLVILLALIALPAMFLIVHSGLEERNRAVTEARKACLALVNSIAAEQQAVVAGIEQLAATLALLPDVRLRHTEAANALLEDLARKNPRYANIVLGDRSGIVWASAVPFTGAPSMADRKYYRNVIRTGMFSSGEYGVGKVAGKPIVSFGYPVFGASGNLAGVIGIGLDLNYAQKLFEKIDLPSGASFSLVDHQGIILIRNLRDSFSQNLVGRRDMRPDNFTRATEGPEEGTFEVMGNDNRFRLVAYKRITLPHESTPYLYIRSSIPLASVTSRAYTAMAKKLGFLVLLFLAGLCLAWLIGQKLIVNPVSLLRKASEQLGAGRAGMSVSEVVKAGELGDLARTFDEMAMALTEREAAIRESEQRFATTLASIGDAVIATDTEGKITFMNAVAETATGWSFTGARGKPVAEVFDIVNEQTREEVESPVARVLREGMTVGLANHTVLVRKDGTEIPIDDSGAPIRDADGKVSGVVLVFRDISERKADEDRMRRLASFPELNPNPVLEVGASGEITFCNPAAEKVLADLGMDKEHCPLFLPGDMGAILADWDGTSDRAMEREVSIKGRVFLETIALTPELNVARIYAREVTERRRALEALQSTLQRFYTILSSMYSAVLLVTDEDTVEFANQTFCDYFKLEEPPQELAGKTNREMIGKIMPAYADPVEAVARIKQIVQEGKAVKGEEVTMAGGRTCLRDFVPVYVDGKSFGRAWYHTDITERRQAEQALRRSHDDLELRVLERTAELSEAYDALRIEMAERAKAEEQLRQAQKMEAIGTLAGGIAHDFNNILASVIGFTEMAIEDIRGLPEVERNLKNVLKSGMRARELVKQILTFSRKTTYERSPLSLTPIIEETSQLLRASIPTTIDIRLSLHARTDAVLASPVEIQQVLMNLATNASLAMQEGGTIEIGLHEVDFEPPDETSTGEYLELTVKDTGVGMSHEVMKRAFEPFYTTREVGKGSGMGLAVVYGIVRDLKGTITVESEEGEGSTFRVFLPVIMTDVKTEFTACSEVPRGTEQILFVDDEEMVTEWGEATLKRLGYRVTALTDSTEALKTFSSSPFLYDLVITDQAMPRMAGVQLVSEILKLRNDVPIILCTGHSETVSPERAKELGIKEFLMKPLARQELAEAVRRALDKLP